MDFEETTFEEKYESLYKKYNKLLEDYDKLKHECSENTVIQSMMDMKNTYESQCKQIEKYKEIKEHFIDTISTCKLMINIIIKKVKYSIPNISESYILEQKLIFINEILDESLKKITEILYLNFLFE